MREIKFRAWDSEEKRWLDSPDWMVCNCGQIALRKSGSLEYACGADKKYILMQFTGLKDKNGKEIYEEDILEVKPHSAQVYRSKVEWHNNGWWLVDPYNSGYWPNSDTCEVIGNIYENPELLTAQSNDGTPAQITNTYKE